MSEDWPREAACKDLPVELFFSTLRADTRRAKAVCASCPVRMKCLEDALEHQDRFGIFGGADHLRRRQALQIDQEGHATVNVKPIRCPYCGEKNITTLLKRRSWMRVSCPKCGLEWSAKRVVPRKPKVEVDDDKAVEPALPSDS